MEINNVVLLLLFLLLTAEIIRQNRVWRRKCSAEKISCDFVSKNVRLLGFY